MDDVKFAYPQLLDSVSDETSSAEFISLKGASKVSEINYSPLSGSGLATLVFSILPPFTSTMIDSALAMRAKCTLVSSGTELFSFSTISSFTAFRFSSSCAFVFPVLRMLHLSSSSAGA